jgi:hypothetical protein
MKNGRGVAVPKFGIFTFSAMNVDLAVSYSFISSNSTTKLFLGVN